MQTHIITKENSEFKIAVREEYYGEYYAYEDIMINYPAFCKGCIKRDVLRKYNIPENDYNLMVHNGKYTVYPSSYNRAKIFIKKTWLDNFLKIKTPKLAPDVLQTELPDFLKNNNKKVIIRGNLKEEELYFNIASVAEVFSVSDLVGNIRANSSIYEEENDYVTFNIKNTVSNNTYFTMDGFTKYLYNAKNKKAKEIRKWCNQLIYTGMLGTSEQKAEIITTHIVKSEQDKKTIMNKLGIDIASYREVINTLGKYSCLYLLILEETDNSYKIKYGRTEDLNARLQQHQKDYGNVYVKFCRYVDDSELTKAETDLKEYFLDNYNQITNYKNKNRLEVFEVKKSDIMKIKTKYDDLSEKYGMRVKYINSSLKETEKNGLIEMKDTAFKTLQSESELKLKIAQLEGELAFVKQEMNLRLNLKDKDIENLQLKLELANFKLNLSAK